MGEVFGPVATVATVVVAATAGYWYRKREWLKEKRYEAYGEYLAAFSSLVDTTLEAFSVHLRLGDTMWSDPEHREAVKPLINRLRSSRTEFGHTTDALVLIASEETYVAAMRLTEFVAEKILKMPPWSRGEKFTEPKEVRRLAGLRSGELILAASRDLGAKATGRKASGLVPEGSTALDAPPS